MPFDLLTVLPTRLDIEVNGFNGGVLNGVPSAYHWYTERYGVKWPCGYDLNISSQGENFIQVDFDTPGSCMSAESLLMCCGGNWNGLPRQMTMSCRKSPDLRG
ncbi:Uncharacterised protein [Shigella sonnei]|nr:Uncharacterised protein [Shigella sonnei]